MVWVLGGAVLLAGVTDGHSLLPALPCWARSLRLLHCRLLWGSPGLLDSHQIRSLVHHQSGVNHPSLPATRVSIRRVCRDQGVFPKIPTLYRGQSESATFRSEPILPLSEYEVVVSCATENTTFIHAGKQPLKTGSGCLTLRGWNDTKFLGFLYYIYYFIGI